MFVYDGMVRKAQVEDIIVGTVLRRIEKDKEGNTFQATFSDCVVIGIQNDTNNPNHITIVELARPYLYANTLGICSNALMGMEIHKVEMKALLSYYSVVLMSTDKIATYNVRE